MSEDTDPADGMRVRSAFRYRARAFAKDQRSTLGFRLAADTDLLVAELPHSRQAAVPPDLNDEDSRKYERRVVDELRREMIGGQGGIVDVDQIELQGSRPDTLVVFRYHHRNEYVGRDPSLVAGPRTEVARPWEFAIDPEDRWSHGLMDPPDVLAAAIGSAFDAAELTLADPVSLDPTGNPPNIFPRRYDLRPPLPK